MLHIQQYLLYIADVQRKLDALPETKLQRVDSTSELDLEMLVKFQSWKNEAMLSNVISPEVAQRIYAALGESISSSNGGWSKHVVTAEKFTILKLMEEIGRIIIARRTHSKL